MHTKAFNGILCGNRDHGHSTQSQHGYCDEPLTHENIRSEGG